jgi:hypothetical protein
VSRGEDRRPGWLRWAQRIQAIAQTGLAYARDPYDRERYEELLLVREARTGRWPPPLLRSEAKTA